MRSVTTLDTPVPGSSRLYWWLKVPWCELRVPCSDFTVVTEGGVRIPKPNNACTRVFLFHPLTGNFQTGKIPVPLCEVAIHRSRWGQLACIAGWCQCQLKTIPNIMYSIHFYSTSRRESDWCCRARVSRQRGAVRPHSGLKVTFYRQNEMSFLFQLSTCCIESGVVQEGMETEVGGRLGGGDGRWQTEP